MSTPDENTDFEQIIQSLDFPEAEEYESRFSLIEKENETGIIDVHDHFMVIIMDQDQDTNMQKWRFVTRVDKESTKAILRKLIEDM